MSVPAFQGFAFPNPGQCEEMVCGVCGRQMEVQRNVVGFTSSTEALAGHRRLHDRFRCANLDLDWHKGIRRLQDAARSTPSRFLKRLIGAEAAVELNKRGCVPGSND